MVNGQERFDALMELYTDLTLYQKAVLYGPTRDRRAAPESLQRALDLLWQEVGIPDHPEDI